MNATDGKRINKLALVVWTHRIYMTAASKTRTRTTATPTETPITIQFGSLFEGLQEELRETEMKHAQLEYQK